MTKENIIVGRLIPVGTGSIVNRMKAIAAERDRELQDEKAKKAAAITHVKQDEQLITT